MSDLVIVAHPDDEVLCCGGTIARRALEGHDVYVAILGEGMTSRFENWDNTDTELLKNLRSQTRRSMELLGVKEFFQYEFPDNSFDSIPLLKVTKVVEELIKRFRPERIYTHHIGDLNIDHEITCRAVLTASRPVSGQYVREVLSCEVPSSTEWSFGRLSPSFQPNIFVDISKTLEQKIRAMLVYESELRTYPHPRSSEALKAIAQKWGSTAGVEVAEAFMLIRAIL